MSNELIINGVDHGVESKLEELSKDNKCKSCDNRGKANAMTHETYCESCIYADSWRVNNYKPMKGVKNDD